MVPPTPTFYVFTPNPLHDGTPFVHDIRVTNVATSRRNNTFRLEQIAVDHEYIVYQVESDASEGVIELHFTYGDEQVVRYKIATREIANRVRPLELMFQDMTDCGLSDEKAVYLTLEGNAAAYALEWDDGSKTIVPAEGRWNGVNHDVRIGARCGTTNVPLEHLHESHHVTLRALFADGRSRVVATSTLQLSPTNVRSPIELLDAPAVVGESSGWSNRPGSTYVVQAYANPTGAAVAGGAAAGGLVIVGGALLRARRRRHRDRL